MSQWHFWDLSQWHFWDHLIRQMGGGPTHAARIAGWAHAPLLARQRDKQVFTARAASCSQKAVRQDPALQVLAQLALDVLRQGTLVRLAHLCEKRLEVLGDNLVEWCILGFAPLVAFRRDWRCPLARSVRSHQRTISVRRTT